jgi:hypothetical protein
MSGVANVFNIPEDDISWKQWSFSLQANLRDINRRILETRNVIIPEYALDPFNLGEPGIQLEQLQVWMDDINAELGIAGFDYLDIDLADKGERTSWVILLSQNVRTATDQLGV